MLCFRCGSHVQDGAEKCWNCGTQLSTGAPKRRGAPTAELRARQRTGSRVFGVVFKIGDLIANRYRVKDIVGSGGAGVVYRAHDQEIDVDVAVKVVNAKLVQTADEQRLFSRQTKIARKLSHQNVVRIYDEGRDEQRPYFTMQFLEGLSLRKIIDLRKEKKQAFSAVEVEPIFNQLCQALEYAHKTTFHGNMKPDNVIVLPDLLKVTDFALLRGLPRKPFLAIQKSRATNIRYLAPEVRFEVPDLDRSVDIYSLGVVLCEMLTGVVYDDSKPEQLSIATSGLDTGLLAVIRRCVARAPKDRYGTPGEVYADVRRAITKGNAKAAKSIPPAEHPANAAEAPTQRLDMSKHGSRPVNEAPEGGAEIKRDEIAARAADKPVPVEVAPSLAVASASLAALDPRLEGREGSGTFDLIDDEMIESAAPAKNTGASAPAPVRAAAPPLNGAVAQSHGSPPASPDLVDNPGGELIDEEEEETQALLDPEPMLIAPPQPSLEEISNSAIELIADPRATNVYNVDGEPERGAETGRNRTVQPVPLPDSAIPEPAFAQVADEATRHGRLDGSSRVGGGAKAPSGPVPMAPSAVVRGTPEAPASARGLEHSSDAGPKMIPRSPTVGFEDSPPLNGANGVKKSARERPMTRPRMSTIAPSPIPSAFTLSEGSARPQTHAAPMFGAGSTLAGVPSPVLAPPPSNNRVLYFTVALSIFAVLLAFVIVVKVTTDQQNAQLAAQNERIMELQKAISQNQQIAQVAKVNEESALADAEKAGVAERDAARAQQEAEARATAEEAKRAAAELEARARDEEAKRHADAAKATADSARRAEAESRAAAAAKAADERRAVAAESGRREREERDLAATEAARREREEKARRDAERRAAEEREARQKAEARAAKLADERASAEAARKAEADEKRKVTSEAKREEDERRKREEAERKRLDDERRAAEAAEKKEAAALAAVAAAEPNCPKGMALIPGGPFMLGSPRNDPERNFGDRDYTSVELKGFCVDYYEYPNGRGRQPTVKASFKTAESRCKRRGKRLCSEEEWEKACKGPSGTRYPYSNQWDPTACNTEDEEGNDRELTKSGTFRKCRSGFNVFDLSGNAAEWTSTTFGTGLVVKGGSADRPGYDGRCAARKKKKATDADDLLGFRCCTDPS